MLLTYPNDGKTATTAISFVLGVSMNDQLTTSTVPDTSFLNVDRWHELIGDPTLVDAILDRLVHNAYRVQLKGESMRKRKQRLTDDEASNP